MRAIRQELSYYVIEMQVAKENDCAFATQDLTGTYWVTHTKIYLDSPLLKRLDLFLIRLL
jgi:hypothetical protein